MSIALELSLQQEQELRDRAAALGLTAEELARAAVADVLGALDTDFAAAAEQVLRKNERLYERLA